jgi:hypothetical protein
MHVPPALLNANVFARVFHALEPFKPAIATGAFLGLCGNVRAHSEPHVVSLGPETRKIEVSDHIVASRVVKFQANDQAERFWTWRRVQIDFKSSP